MKGEERGAPTEEQGHSGASGPLLQACPTLIADSQDSGHSGGADRPGSVDREGPEPCHNGCKCHALGLPAVASGVVGAATTRLSAAAHVGGPPRPQSPRAIAPGMCDSRLASHAALCPQGPCLSGQHGGPSAGRGYVPR